MEVSRALTPPVSAWHRAWVLAHPVLVLIAKFLANLLSISVCAV
jgi:hypothetical protein